MKNKEIQVGMCFANTRKKVNKKSNPRKRSKFKARKSR